VDKTPLGGRSFAVECITSSVTFRKYLSTL